MAQRVQVMLTCDLDDDDVEAIETVTFGTDGATYEIEMCQQHLDEYHNWMHDYVSRGRKVGGSRRTRARSGSTATTSRSRANSKKSAVPSIREWARANGFKVSSRGRIPYEVRSAYDAAH